MQTETFYIPGMDSEAAAQSIAQSLASVEGVNAVRISSSHKRAQVSYDGATTSTDKLRAAIGSAGFLTEQADAGSCCGGCCH